MSSDWKFLHQNASEPLFNVLTVHISGAKQHNHRHFSNLFQPHATRAHVVLPRNHVTKPDEGHGDGNNDDDDKLDVDKQ